MRRSTALGLLIVLVSLAVAGSVLARAQQSAGSPPAAPSAEFASPAQNPSPSKTDQRLDALEQQAKQAQSSGDNAWMLTSCALVLLMTGPGLALFYGGLVRRKNVLATMM